MALDLGDKLAGVIQVLTERDAKPARTARQEINHRYYLKSLKRSEKVLKSLKKSENVLNGLKKSDCKGASVFVRIGTPQWEAWDADYRRKRGIAPPINKEGTGWYHASEWPPGKVVSLAEQRP